MKNAMKKIMSLMLVAMLLVSVFPVSAAAADPFGGFNAAPQAPATTVEENQEDVSDLFKQISEAPNTESQEQENPNDGIATLSLDGTGAYVWEGGFPNVEIHEFISDANGYGAGALIKKGSIVLGTGPDALSVKTMVDTLLPAGWEKDYTFVRAASMNEDSSGYTKTTTNINETFAEQEKTIYIDVVTTPEYTINVHLMQTTANGEHYEIGKKTLTQVRTLNFNTLYDLIPPTDTNYAYRLATAGIVYNGKKLHSNQTAVPIVNGDYDVYIYLDVVDANSNAPVVYPLGSTGTGNGTTGNGIAGGTTTGGTTTGGTTTGGTNLGGGLVGVPSGSTTTNKFPYNVYLNIYKDTMVGSPDKTINITNGAALDGTVTMDEVKAIAMEYYNAKNSYGITFDGLYLAEGTWVTNYVTDTQKYDAFVNVDKLRAQRTVYINVMIGNANAKNVTTYTADSSNPKTGDSIYTAMTVMGLSAAALATAVYFYNKKRAVV